MSTEHPGLQAQPGLCGPAAKGKDSNNVKHEQNLQSPSAVQEGMAKTGAAMVSLGSRAARIPSLTATGAVSCLEVVPGMSAAMFTGFQTAHVS